MNLAQTPPIRHERTDHRNERTDEHEHAGKGEPGQRDRYRQARNPARPGIFLAWRHHAATLCSALRHPGLTRTASGTDLA